MTTIIVEDRDESCFTIHQYRQAQLVDIQYKVKKLNGESCIPIIFIRRSNGENISETYKKMVFEFLKHFSRNIKIYFDEIEPYLESFGNYLFREMRKRKLIQLLPTGDDLVVQKTIVKLYLKKPYPVELKEFSDHPIYIPVLCPDGLQYLFSCFWCSIVDHELRLFKTSGNEMVLCSQQFATNLSYQMQMPERGDTVFYSKLDASCLRGRRVCSEIIPHDLILVPEISYSRQLNTCHNYTIFQQLDMYFSNQLEYDLLRFNARIFESMDQVHTYLETNLAGKSYEKEESHVHNLDMAVSIQLDVSISSKMLKSKILQRKKGNDFEIGERVRSILFERNLGYDYGFSPLVLEATFENRWCLTSVVREWLNSGTIDHTNDLKVKNILRKMRKVNISNNAEFTPKERRYNYFLSSTFALCFMFFKENNIELSQLTDEVWDYILNPGSQLLNGTIFYNLQQKVLNHSDLHILDFQLEGVQIAGLSSYFRKQPFRFMHYNFPSLERRMSMHSPKTSMVHYYDNIPDFLHIFNLTKIEIAIEYREKLNLFLSDILKIKKRGQCFPVHDNILDEYLRNKSYDFMKKSKNNYEIGNYRKIIRDFGSILLDLKRIAKLKRRLKQDYSGTFFEVLDLISISMFPITTILSSYIQKTIFNRNVDNIQWIVKDYDSVTRAKYRYFTRILNGIKRVLKTNNQSTSPIIIVIEVLPETRKFNHHSFIVENKEMIENLLSITDIKIKLLDQVRTPRIFIQQLEE